MCRCLQYYLESCYWHLIEKRFCYDESIALYEEPEKEEKNNNFFDNMAFYDSVSVIAGRAIVTIDPLPEEKPIMQQPTRKIRWRPESIRNDKQVRSVSIIHEVDEERHSDNEDKNETTVPVEKIRDVIQVDSSKKPQLQTLKPENLELEIPRKSLSERRMSKNLYLKIERPKEIPIIRQQSIPKFYLDTPSVEEQASASIFRGPSSALASPVPQNNEFVYDLYSIVQRERERTQGEGKQAQVHRKESERSSRLKDIIKLRRAKSSVGTTVINLPHSHQHI